MAHTPARGWVRELTHQQPAPVPWARMLRMTIAVTTPIAVGASVGQLGLGLLCSIGALGATLADPEGPYRLRALRLLITTSFGAAGFILGGFLYGHAVLTAVVIVLAGLVMGLISVLGSTASVASLQFLIYLIVASGADFGPIPRWVLPVCYVIGAAWALGLTLVGSIGRVSVPERLAVANVFTCAAAYMDASGTPVAQSARQDLTAAMNKAYDAVMMIRQRAGGRDSRVRKLGAMLNAIVPAIESTTSLAARGMRVPDALQVRVEKVARLLTGRGTIPPHIRRRRTRYAEPPSTTAPIPVVDPRPDVVQIVRSLDTIDEIIASGARRPAAQEQPSSGPSAVTRALRLPGTSSIAIVAPPSFRQRLGKLRDAVVAGPATWQPVLRLVLCLAVANAVAVFDPVERPYWIAMTVAVTLKPDFGSVFARAIQRGVGTIVGVLVGSLVLLLSSNAIVPVIAIGVFSFFMPMAQRRNYGMFATFLTPVIVLLLDVIHSDEAAILLGRVFDTAIGCAIVLLVGYLPWPGTWRSRSRFGDRISDALGAVKSYSQIGFEETGGSRIPARRHAYRTLSDLRTVLQQAFSEPPPVSTTAAAWWPMVVALERTTDALTTAILAVNAGSLRPHPDAVHRLEVVFDELIAVTRGAPNVRMSELPDDPALVAVSDELHTAQTVAVTVAGAVLAAAS